MIDLFIVETLGMTKFKEKMWFLPLTGYNPGKKGQKHPDAESCLPAQGAWASRVSWASRQGRGPEEKPGVGDQETWGSALQGPVRSSWAMGGKSRDARGKKAGRGLAGRDRLSSRLVTRGKMAQSCR